MIPVSKPGSRPPPSPASPSAPRAAAASPGGRLGGATEAIASPGTQKTLWQSWLSLTPKVRMTLGVSVAVFAVLGMAASDKLQAKFPAPESEDEKARKAQDAAEDAAGRPKRFGIRVVDKHPPAAAP
ncbi:hypothetical protein OC834_004796 [Tilletia horrida]|uniref:Cytochrome c oxidase assembly factor 3 n=1 Tax=Tilletia horrida TaxID=155126 RepID=A0AAN6G6N9_9BASI|nr:hypothetical protein OC842_007244 [Tilletia horrida]KAK0522366.1 hypothetical protein OC835_006599 [Tilletia horrida]KAK0526475.1 hypothetical protein OC834_004796 [Tilletia horrida]KAK0563035.1 hypothetical protein OC844_002399 [Tilletia horrida]